MLLFFYKLLIQIQRKRLNIKRHFKVLLLVLLVLLGSVLLFFAVSNGGNKMETPYNINEAKTLKPELYDIGTEFSLSLFPVPQNNAIGTNDLNNAITLLSFHKGKIKYDKYFKNAIDDVEGGGEYLPVIAPDTIGFGQSRRFLLYNFRTRDVRYYRIVMSLEETIEKISIADARRRHFIFEISLVSKICYYTVVQASHQVCDIRPLAGNLLI